MSKSSDRMTAYINELIERSGRKQADIAAESGFERANVLSMIKAGAKLPISRVVPFAKAVRTDPKALLQMALEEYHPELWEAINDLYLFGAGAHAEGMSSRSAITLTEGEIELIKALRKLNRTKQARDAFQAVLAALSER